MKYKEWLKKEISELKKEESQHYPHEELIELNKVVNVIDQLDELETLSQEWIDEYTEIIQGKSNRYHVIAGGHYVRVPLLENLIVNEPGDNQVVITKPEIPQWVADELEDETTKKLTSYGVLDRLNRKVAEDQRLRSQRRDIWLAENGHIIILAKKFGYTVKEEPKYNVAVRGKTPSGKMSVGVYLWKSVDGEVCIGDNFKVYNPNKKRYQLTEQEIKDYDKRYWAFAKSADNHGE